MQAKRNRVLEAPRGTQVGALSKLYLLTLTLSITMCCLRYVRPARLASVRAAIEDLEPQYAEVSLSWGCLLVYQDVWHD